jgi:hypothetical protein
VAELANGPGFEATSRVNFGNLFKAFDALVALGSAVSRLRGREETPVREEPTGLTYIPPGSGLAGQLEARLTNVVVAALKEAFDRDHARLELERAQIEDQRRRAEEAMRLELRRQAAERELGRLRLLAGTALVGWIASVLVLGVRLEEASSLARVVLGAGWLLLLGALASAFSAQARVNAYVPEPNTVVDGGPAAAAALWLLVGGLALTAISLLIA